MNETSKQERSLREYANVLLRRKFIVLLCPILAIGAAAGLSFATTPVYEAGAQMVVVTQRTDTVFQNSSGTYVDPDRAIQTEIRILQSTMVAERVAQKLELATDTPKVTGTSIAGTNIVSVTVRDQDPVLAQQSANAYIDSYIEIKREQAVNSLVAAGEELQKKVTEIQQQIDALDTTAPDAAADRQALLDQQGLFKQRLDQLQVDAALTDGGAQLVRSAKEPTIPVEPRPLRSGVLAGVAGIVGGILLVLLLDLLDDTFRTADDLERSLPAIPVLAVVPTEKKVGRGPIALSAPSDLAVEAYRGLRTSLQFLGLDADARVIQVSSSIAGEGKTTTAANLAAVFAQAQHRVVLIDADLRQPRVHEVFSMAPQQGLTHVLLGRPSGDLVTEVADDLDVLPAGSVPANPSEMLGSKNMHELIAELAAAYDIVIIDSAPILPVTDSVALTKHVQAVVLVIQSGKTSRKKILQSVARLRSVDAPLVGVVLNRSKRRRSDKEGYGYGHGY